jgi:hypothetical protein
VTTRIVRAPHAIDNDSLMRMAITRAKELAEQRRELKAEEDRMRLLLAQHMRDNDAQELTVGGVPVARLTEYEQSTVKVSELLARFPMAITIVNRTPVVRVDLP